RPLSAPLDAGAVADRLAARPEVAGLSLQPGTLRIAAEELLAAHGALQLLGAADARQVEALRAAAGPTGTVAEVPLLDEDVHDLEHLGHIGRYLFPA
ncbi:MAG TPA: hypothetical protein VMZ28_29565, partial [Kofleriaceae bacterium]|nr:hypothetical protein [Kofleriaceae bacterium]